MRATVRPDATILTAPHAFINLLNLKKQCPPFCLRSVFKMPPTPYRFHHYCYFLEWQEHFTLRIHLAFSHKTVQIKPTRPGSVERTSVTPCGRTRGIQSRSCSAPAWPEPESSWLRASRTMMQGAVSATAPA